jgi:iron(III) transport system permease protein
LIGTTVHPGGWSLRTPSVLTWVALIATLVVILPLLGVGLAAARGPWAGISSETVLDYGATSVALAVGVGVLASLVGVTSAWLVTQYRFPGSRAFAWLLVLPLAAPTFALAYGYADLLDVAGPVRTWLRHGLGVEVPGTIRSLPGAILVLSLAFYPYVYLAVRDALLNRSSAANEAARALGASPARVFWRITLPMARPALAAGLALTLMETLADYGAVSFLSVQTLTTGVVRAWSVNGSPASAASLGLPLLATAAALLILERWSRSHRAYGVQATGWRTVPARPLSGWAALAATTACCALLFLAFLLPLGWLGWNGLQATPEWPRLAAAASRVAGLGVAAAVLATILALALALAGRGRPLLTRLAGLGYATPGAVMAIGLLVPAGLLWRALPGPAWMFVSGLALLVYAYAARLMAAALEPIASALTRIRPSMSDAARSLGRSPLGTAWAIHVPLAGGGLLTAGLIVFIDVVKELPATLILRPFNFDTLAVLADAYARDERIGQAAWPSLMIVAVAVPACLWLTHRISRSRPGRSASDDA